jgi:DNA recombination protein RmuC
MTEIIIIIIASIFFGVLGFLIGRYTENLKGKSDLVVANERILLLKKQLLELQKTTTANNIKLEKSFSLQLNEKNEELHKVNNQREFIREQKELSILDYAKLESEFKNLQKKNLEQNQEVIQLQEKFTKEFENLANKILDEKTDKFTALNKENIKNILTPLQEKITHFEKKVEDTHKASIGQHASLKEQILGLKDLNLKMSKEATNLTKALKGDTKLQGNWGELVLERVLEKSGLEKNREYFVQKSFVNDNGDRVLPDVVISLPDNKKMIVDSKVSLVHYEQYVNEEDETLRESFLKEHVNSIKRHVEQLGDKSYHDLYKIDSPDFVLLFIPIEPAFAIALNLDNSLYNKAFERNIVIVTPTTLLATLRTIDTMWNNEKQQKNAVEIARQAGALYDKFHNLMLDLMGVGKDIDKAKLNYSSAMNKLYEGKGNLITSVEKIKKLGAKAKKSLPESVLNKTIKS